MDRDRRDTDVVKVEAPEDADRGEPAAFDPDLPTPAVGSWPSLDPRRLGLPPLAWLFVAGAVFVAWRSITQASGTPLTPGPVLNAAIGTVWAVLPLLVPAALLWRVPDAPRRLPALLAGLTLAGLIWLVAPYEAEWAAAGEPFPTIVQVVDGALVIASPLLVGFGLLRLRGGRPDRLGLLAAIALVYGVGIAALQLIVLPGSVPPDAAWTAALLLRWLAGAFAVWVPVAAWLDRAPPRAFWALLAVGFPLTLVMLGLGLVANLVDFGGVAGSASELGWIVYVLVAMTPSVLALVAYGRFVPVPVEPGRTSPEGARMPLAPA